MFKPLTQLKYFFQLATDRKLSGSDQLMYLHIFNKFNQAHWTETLRIKDAELKDLLRLYDSNGKPASIDVIRRGRQRLKAKGFIEFTSGDGHEPEYRLACLHPADTPADSPTDTPADSLKNSYIRAREDVKTFKTENLLTATIAGANSQDLEKILDYWEQSRFGRLDFELISKLEVYIDRYGYSAVKDAMDAAKDSNGSPFGVSFKYFTSVLENRVNSKPLKGGETHGAKVIEYGAKRSGHKPWEDIEL